MEEKNKREEIQSRREFFKKAAKAALPVVGAVVMANLPSFAQAVENGCSGCSSNCSGSCTGGCRICCEGGCKDTCKGTCMHTCKGTCKYSSK